MTKRRLNWTLWAFAMVAGLVLATQQPAEVLAQDQPAKTSETAAPAPLTEDELEVLAARIALYPDELIAVISAASLYPLQIVEAARFLDALAKDKNLKPKDSWDGSVISLLNYPELVKMMSDDLDWTQAFGNAIAYQQKDVLIAIQQLRDEAVAKGILKSDEKIKVTEQNENVVIQSASAENIYVPRYEPEMLYVADYPIEPISYYPEPYPSYWYPGATFFAAAVTGAAWAAAVNWDDWGVWGGRWNGGDIDIDCNRCLNNIDVDRELKFNEIDWKNVDRSKINVDRSQFSRLDSSNIRNNLQANSDNALRNRAADIRSQRPGSASARQGATKDIRKSTLEGLKNKPGNVAQARPGSNSDVRRADSRPNAKKPAGSKPSLSKQSGKKGSQVKRSSGKQKPAARVDNRPRNPNGLGNIDRGRVARVNSNRGYQSMGGGYRGGARAMHGGGGGHRAVHRGGGGRRR